MLLFNFGKVKRMFQKLHNFNTSNVTIQPELISIIGI